MTYNLNANTAEAEVGGSLRVSSKSGLHIRFEANLVYIVSCRTAWASEF